MSTDIRDVFSELWRAAPSARPATPAPRVVFDSSDIAALMTAARRARTRYPGPVGELIADEIGAYITIGRRFAGRTIIGRVIAELLDE